MAERRPFPPSPRRRALARAAGLHAGSPLLVGACACAGAALVVPVTARSAAERLGDWLSAACAQSGGLAPAALPTTILELAVPVIGLAMIAAAIAHVAQTRTLWLPRRRIPGAPQVDRQPWHYAGRELTGALVIGAVTVLWLWWAAPALAHHPDAAVMLLASFLGTMAVAWVALGTVDALARWLALDRALHMSAAERREDQRQRGADPRWRTERARVAREQTVFDAMAGCALVVLGDDSAAAIAWDPVRRPVPWIMAAGRRARATQLLGLARRYGIPVHRDVALADRLVTREGPVDASDWPRLAEIVAATQRR